MARLHVLGAVSVSTWLSCFSAMLAPSLVRYALVWESAINYRLHVLICPYLRWASST